MTDGSLELQTFWTRNRFGKTSYYYLKRLGRAPQTISIGTKEMVTPEAEAEWRREMAKNPIRGSLRKAVEAKEGAERKPAGGEHGPSGPTRFGPLAPPKQKHDKLSRRIKTAVSA
jgi:hypothetical protein